MRPLLTPKVAPHSEEAEQSVLAGLMLDERCHVEIFALVREDEFYFERHRLIFRTLLELSAAGKPCDFIVASNHLRNKGQLESVDGLQYLGSIVNDSPGAANAVEYAKIVRERAALRAVIAAGDAMIEAAFRPEGRTLVEILSGAETAIETIRTHSHTENTALPFAALRVDLDAHFQAAEDARRHGGTVGISTGLHDLDMVIGGLQKQRFYGIAARPGTGKSALLNQIAMHAACNGRKGLIITAEMTGLELYQRALAAKSGINLFHIISGAPNIHSSLSRAADALGNPALWIDGDTNTLSGAIAQMALHKARYGIEWAAVDHIGLMETQKFPSRNDQIGYITRSLKKAAKQLNIAVVGLMQLNRGSEGESRRPQLHDLRDSGNIEQDLDVAIFLHTNADKRTEKVKPLDIGVLKNRGGMNKWLTGFDFHGATQRIVQTGDHPHSDEIDDAAEWKALNA